jgi:hypothetical protein
MTTITQNWWIIFLGCFTIMIITSLWMAAIARHFYTAKEGLRSFSIFDLEFAATEAMLDKIVFYSTDDARKQLRRHLWVDFLFMPAVYIGIALLCYKTALKMEWIGRYLFFVLAALQALPWLFDILENNYLFQKLRKKSNEFSTQDSPGFKAYQFFVKAKFTIALTGTICSVFGLLYFWLMGSFATSSLLYLLLAMGEVVVFLWIGNKIKKTKTAFAG